MKFQDKIYKCVKSFSLYYFHKAPFKIYYYTKISFGSLAKL